MRSIKRININNNKCEVIYKSIKLASIENNIQVSNIQKCCKKQRPTAGGFIWDYVS